MKKLLLILLLLSLLTGCAPREDSTEALPAENAQETLPEPQPEVPAPEEPRSAETLPAFVPLEELPELYDAGTAAQSDVVYTNDGVKNGAAVAEFLEKVDMGTPCHLRTVQDYGENSAMLIDVLFENGHFLWRMRQGGEVVEERFSYLVTDGVDLYLSNGADWETAERYAGKELAWLVPMNTAEPELVGTVERMTAARSGSVRYRVWSADGMWSAALTDVPTEFRVEGQGFDSRTYDLSRWDGLETAVWGLEWQDGKLVLICETVDGGSSRLVFDPVTEQLTKS